MAHEPAPCAGCHRALDRRQFLSAAAVASITAVLTGCGDGVIGGITAAGNSPGGGGTTPGSPLPSGGVVVRLADVPALAAVGGVARVTATGTPIAAYRSGTGTFQAFSMACPHAGTTVDITPTGFRCPNHGAQFAKNGAWTGGQPSGPLVEYPVSYDAAAGTLTITSVPGAGGSGGTTNGGSTPTGSTLSVRVADFPALAAVGGVARVTTTGTPIALYRAASNTFLAVSLVCPHAGATVSITSTGFRCPSHGAVFNKNGEWVSGQRTSALLVKSTTYDAKTGLVSIPLAGLGSGGDDDDDDDGRDRG